MLKLISFFVRTWRSFVLRMPTESTFVPSGEAVETSQNPLLHPERQIPADAEEKMPFNEDEIQLSPDEKKVLNRLLEGIKQPEYAYFKFDEITDNVWDDARKEITYYDENGKERRFDAVYPDGFISTRIFDETEEVIFTASITYQVPSEGRFSKAFYLIDKTSYIDMPEGVSRSETVTTFNENDVQQISVTTLFDKNADEIK
jgi:hypothetical protein